MSTATGAAGGDNRRNSAVADDNTCTRSNAGASTCIRSNVAYSIYMRNRGIHRSNSAGGSTCSRSTVGGNSRTHSRGICSSNDANRFLPISALSQCQLQCPTPATVSLRTLCRASGYCEGEYRASCHRCQFPRIHPILPGRSSLVFWFSLGSRDEGVPWRYPAPLLRGFQQSWIAARHVTSTPPHAELWAWLCSATM